MPLLALLLLAAALHATGRVDAGSPEILEKLLATSHWFRALDRYSIPKSTSFRLLPNVFMKSDDKDAHLTLATQCSIESVHEIKDMAEASDSRISAAVLILKHIGKSYQLVKRLRDCSPDIARKVDFHFVFADGPDLYADFNVSTSHASFHDLAGAAAGVLDEHVCSDVLSRGMALLFDAHANYVSKGIPYPVNLLRNVALRYVTTPHAMTLDIDLVPSVRIGEEYGRALQQMQAFGLNTTTTALVVPGGFSALQTCPLNVTTAFEGPPSIAVPRSRQYVLQLLANNTIRVSFGALLRFRIS